jgi:hypothetical protein
VASSIYRLAASPLFEELAAIQDPDSIERVLRAMGLPWQAPQLAVARAPPEIWG